MKSISFIIVWILSIKFDCTLAFMLKEPVVRLEQGVVRGRFLDTPDGQKFYGFTGIPFARPPVGNLRFKPPQPAESWNGTLNATSNPAKCPQMETSLTTYVGDEDCLKLNVFCHSLPPVKKSLPVLVVIHGGGFQIGSASDFPPNRLMEHGDIVIVAIQYRLLSLGFLSTNDSAASGNYGLLDQIAALQWVQKNIRHFGGDPNKVTLIGGSAGAMSIGFHLVSPLAKGLFRGVYLLSGSPLMNGMVQKDPLPIAKLVGTSVGCHSNDTSILLSCLRQIPVKQLIESSALNIIFATRQTIPLAPVIDKGANCNYLCDSPERLFKLGKFHRVTTVSGTTKDETASVILLWPDFQYLKASPVATTAAVDNFFDVHLPPFLGLLLQYQNNLLNLSRAVRREYEAEYNFTITKELFQFMIDMSTDATFRSAADQLTRLQASKVITYLYSFDYHGDLFNSTPTNFGDKEVDHAVNAAYFYLTEPYSDRDGKMSDILVRQLINFVKNLNPNQYGGNIPRWTPTPNTRQLCYLKYGDNQIAMQTGYYTRKMEFWGKDAKKIVFGEA